MIMICVHKLIMKETARQSSRSVSLSQWTDRLRSNTSPKVRTTEKCPQTCMMKLEDISQIRVDTMSESVYNSVIDTMSTFGKK